jgi:DNA helicase-2/ATP-dependent DNA helicase PcrA
MAKEKGVSEIFVAFLEDSGYLRHLVSANENEKLDLLNQFYKKVKSFEESSIEPLLRNFMEEMNLELESGEEGKLQFDPEQGPDMIKVMTIHGAKGLEFKYVFLVNMVDRRFPTDQRKDPIELPDALIKDIKPIGDVHLQEERRLCYVAMTRAKKELYFTSADDYGGQRKKKLSRFLIEMNYKNEASEKEKSESGLLAEKIKPTDRLSKKVEAHHLPEHFSYSQLAAFEKCPLQYKFSFILKVPTRGKAAFSFGHTMHNTLAKFLRETSKSGQENLFGEKSANNASLDKLLKIYDKEWVDEWYESKKQRDEYYKKGKESLKEFFDQATKNPPNVLKIAGELAIELPFNLKVGEYTLYGVIDRIDELGSGVSIIDYKTGESKDKPDKDQLLIYQIAAQEVLQLEPKQLSYYYLDDGKVVSFLGTEKETEEKKEKILEQINKIKNSEFEPTPGWQCQYCDFKDICDWAQK